MSVHRALPTFAVVVVGLLGGTTLASAQDVAAAASAFSRAQAAELEGMSRRAAELFELADTIAPTPEALRSALRARVKAGDKAIGASHAERLLERYPNDREARRLARRTLADLSPELTRHDVRCENPCMLVVDEGVVGSLARLEHRFYTDPGQHQLVASFPEGQTADRLLVGAAGEQTTFEINTPPAPAKPKYQVASTASLQDDRGVRVLSPAVTVVGSIITAGLAAATIWSGVDVQNKHDEYLENPTIEGYDDGVDREQRTNILLGVTIGTAVATGMVAAFFTDWKGDSSEKQNTTPEVQFGVSPEGATLAWQKHY